ncbi:AAA family ATPase [Glutamicibacter sp. BSL13]
MSDKLPTKRVLLTPASQIQTRRQKWFWEPFTGQGVIPLGTATIVAGKGGEGKTTFMLHLAALASRGQLPGDLHGQKMATIVIGPEDDWDTVMVPRLKAAGADLDRIYQIEVESTLDEYTSRRSLKFPLDVDVIEEAVMETGAKVLVVDPAPSLMHGDMNKVQDVRQSYEPLIALAQRLEMALILINHFNKGGGTVSGGLSGSHAWRDLTRSYLAFATDEESGERIFSQDKNNYGETKGSYKFVLESVDVTTDDGETASVAKVNFLGETDQTVSDLISRTDGDEGEHEDRNAAQGFILDYIKQNDAWEAKAGDVLKAGKAAGFSDNELKNARKRSKNPRILSAKSDFGAGWVWRLEPTETTEGVTKVSKVSRSQIMTPSTPWGEKVTPSTEECPIHGVDIFGDCFTCTTIREGKTA